MKVGRKPTHTIQAVSISFLLPSNTALVLIFIPRENLLIFLDLDPQDNPVALHDTAGSC